MTSSSNPTKKWYEKNRVVRFLAEPVLLFTRKSPPSLVKPTRKERTAEVLGIEGLVFILLGAVLGLWYVFGLIVDESQIGKTWVIPVLVSGFGVCALFTGLLVVLKSSAITPKKRSGLENVLNKINGSSDRLTFYEYDALKKASEQLVEIVLRSTVYPYPKEQDQLKKLRLYQDLTAFEKEVFDTLLLLVNKIPTPEEYQANLAQVAKDSTSSTQPSVS